MALDINKTYKSIVAAARSGQFTTYGELAHASGVEWPKARHVLPNQLGQLVKIAHDRGWPMLSSIVVGQDHVKTGELQGESLKGFLGAAAMVGLKVTDPESFYRAQQKEVFKWAKTAPDELGGELVGPRFIRYFVPVLDALRALGGESTPDEVFAWIKEHVDVPIDQVRALNKSGQSKFENGVAWARFYLSKAGLIDGSKRGIWKLTSEGLNTTLTHSEGLKLFRDVRAQFATAQDEEETAPEVTPEHELFADPERSFWFVGAVWGGTDDQSARFFAENIWQNGEGNNFDDIVKRMKPGDRIAIKSSFTRKNNLPFENFGKPVSCMRIKAIGTVTANQGDGKTVSVDWKAPDPPRDWFFYTYRVTVVEADRDDELARRLILFAFANTKQDYEYFLRRVPYFAKKYGAESEPADDEGNLGTEALETEEEAAAPSYTIDQIIDDGCFLPRERLAGMLTRVEAKKNLVLQGPPGTGKSWLAKRLAYALIGTKDPKVIKVRLRVVQFHPSLSYEDFVRGMRPSASANGKLDLVDGVFLEIIEAAKAEPDRPFVLVIEEINRGNPAQIFGELVTLLEDSKRNRDEAIELAYRRGPDERVYVPRNLYVIGTMNIADRSLALVDLALRRRFAFESLTPQLSGQWKGWCIDRCGMSAEVVSMIEQRVSALNGEIEQDRSLGPQYRIGHSYVTPQIGVLIADARTWFRDVARTEIIPLLEEYWFDAPDKVTAAAQKLLEGV